MTISLPVRRVVFGAALLVGASAAQCAWAVKVSLHGARPDMVLVVALLCAQFCSSVEGAAVGLGAGLMSASLAAPFDGGFGSIVVSRTVVCFAVGWLEERIYRDNPAIAIAVVSGGTLLAEAAFFAFDPHFPAVRWARGVAYELTYNICLTLPVYLIVRLCMQPRKVVLTGPIT